MKKLFIVLLCLLVTVSLISCGNKETSSLESQNETGSSQTESVGQTETNSNPQADSQNRVPDEYIPTDPVEKETEVMMEGEPEKVTVTQFKRDGYTLWYDTTYFYTLNDDGTKERITVYGRYDDIGSVSMTVTTNKVSAAQAAENLRVALVRNIMDVNKTEKAENVTVEGTLHFMAQNAEISSDYENFYSDLPEEICSAYFVPNGKNASYTVYLSYPPECTEGYGARLEAMFREIEFK